MCVNNSRGLGLFIMCVWMIVEFWAIYVYLEIQTVYICGMFVREVFVQMYEIYVIVLCVWIMFTFLVCCEGGFCSNVWNICYCIICVNNSWIWGFLCESGNTDWLHFGYVYLLWRTILLKCMKIYVIVLCVWIIVEFAAFHVYIWKYRLCYIWVCLFVCEGCFVEIIWNTFFMLLYYVSELNFRFRALYIYIYIYIYIYL